MSNPVEDILRTHADWDDRSVIAPPRLKSRLYSLLVRTFQETSALRSLSESKKAGYELCQWEKLMTVVPGVGHVNHCYLCHARVLAESLERVPLPWTACPYARFHNPEP